MPNTRDDVAVYPADSDALAGLIAMQSVNTAAHTVRQTLTLGLFQPEQS